VQTDSVHTVHDPKEEIREDTISLMHLIGQLNCSCQISALEADADWRFVKTHRLPADDDYPGIVLVRDGRDAIVSHAHFILRTEYDTDAQQQPRLFEETLEQLIIGEATYAFGGWSRNVREWMSRKRTAIIRYEILIVDPVCAIMQALRCLKIPLPFVGNSVPPFEELHKQVPWFFRKGKVGSWRDDMPHHLEELLLERHGALLTALGYAMPRETAP